MDSKVLFKTVMRQVDSCVERIRDNQLSESTPCSEWDLKHLLNHIVYELLWIPDLLAGKTVKEVGDEYDGDVLGQDFHAAWKTASDKAQQAVESANLESTVHLSYADVPASDYITEMAGEMLVHGWDAGQSTNCTMRYEDEVYTAVYEYIEPRMEGFRAAGLIGPELQTISSDKRTQLLALYGREDKHETDNDT